MPPLPIRPNYLPFGRPDFTDEEIAAITRVIRCGWIGMVRCPSDTRPVAGQLAAAQNRRNRAL